MLRMVDKELVIWTAGIFDGEGSALIERTGTNAYQITVAVGSMDSRITDPIRAVWGGHYKANQDYLRNAGLSMRRDYSLYFSRDEAKRFLTDVFPYLKSKGDEAATVLRALLSIPGEAALGTIGRKRLLRRTTKSLEPYYLELRQIRTSQGLTHSMVNSKR